MLCKSALLVLLAILISKVASRKRCQVTPLVNFMPKKIQGTWYAYKFLPPTSKISEVKLRFSMEITMDKQGNLFRNETARLNIPPYDCKYTSRTMRPLGIPGVYRWENCNDIPLLQRADLLISDTDYKRFLVIWMCMPSFKKCSPSAAIYSRKPFASKKLRKYTEKLVRRKYCSNPRKWLLIQKKGVQDCFGKKGYLR